MNTQILGATSPPAGRGFVRIGATDNFYQTSAFIPMSFALVTTVHENGETVIGPHALCFPFSVAQPYAMLLISRGNSLTAANIRRTRRCALNYVEADEDRLRAIAALGYPGLSIADKARRNPFTLVPSPIADRQRDPGAPCIIGEAFQVIECTWNDALDLGGGNDSGSPQAARFVLDVNHILLQERLAAGVTDGGAFPNMPIFFGYRATGDFWFAAHQPPFPIPPPRVEGMELQSVQYLASRMDETIRFNDAACARLTRVPRPFLPDAMKKLIEAARQRGVTEIDPEFLDDIGRERGAS